MTPSFIQTGRLDDSSLSIRSGPLVGTYNFRSITRSIVDCLKAFDRHLYFGYMHRHVFLYGHYLAAKEKLIKDLLDIENLSEDQVANIGFCFYMCRVAQNQIWKYPALLNRDPMGRVQQITGNSRAFASLLVHDRPWEKYPILMSEHKDFDPTTILKDPVPVDSDEKLKEILALNADSQDWTQSVEIILNVEPSPDGLWCRLDYIGNGTYHDHRPPQGKMLLSEYKSWRQRYDNPTPLAVYTQWPHLLSDRFNLWKIDIVGSAEGICIDNRLGTAEQAVRAYHRQPTLPHDHVLWVIQERPIDLTDLLFWLDTAHSTYISQDWQFILWRRQQEYANNLINISRAVG